MGLQPGASIKLRDDLADNGAVYDAWHAYQQTRLRPVTLRHYGYEVQAFLGELDAHVKEYTQQDMWAYLDAYLANCRHLRRGQLAGATFEARPVCMRRCALANCGTTCPRFEYRTGATTEKHLQAISTLYDFLARRGVVAHNYVQAVKKAYRREARPTRIKNRFIPSTADVVALAANGTTPAQRFLYVLLAKTGIRSSEARALRVDPEFYDPRGGWFLIPDDGGKRRGNRYVIIDRELRRHLDTYLEWRRHVAAHPYLLVNIRGQAVIDTEGHGIRRAMKADQQRLGMDGPLTPHAFRHYFSDHLMKHGCDGYWWNILRGDIPHGNTKTYVHPTVDDVRRQYLRHAPRLG